MSNAYNRPDQLSPELRRRVLETARRLGYPGPDPVARSLRTRKAGAVGLLLTENLSYAFRDPAALGFLEGLALACEGAGQGLHLVPVNPEREDVAAVHRAGVDGFVVYSVPDDDPHLAAVLSRPVPTVVCDQPRVNGVDRVGIDDRAAITQLAERLITLGHRRIGVVCMRLARDRNDGFVASNRQHEAHFHVQRTRLAGARRRVRGGRRQLGACAGRRAVRPQHRLGRGRGRATAGHRPGDHRADLHLGHPGAGRADRSRTARPAGAARPHGDRLRRNRGGRAGRPDHGPPAGAGEGQGGRQAAARRRPSEPGRAASPWTPSWSSARPPHLRERRRNAGSVPETTSQFLARGRLGIH